jgi:hypothetical protein
LKENIIPSEIEAIVSREYIFQLKLNEYNLKKGWENYTITKIFEPPLAKEADIEQVTINFIVCFKNLYNAYLHNYIYLLMKHNYYRRVQLSI